MATRRQRKGYMSSEKPTPDEVAALLNGLTKERQPEQREPTSLEIACGGRLLLVQTPANIVLKAADGTQGDQFYVTDIQAWGYSPFGILAVGSWSPDAPEDEWESRLFAADTIHNIEFNKARYEEIIEAIRAEEAAQEDEEPADPGEANTEDSDFEGIAVAG